MIQFGHPTFELTDQVERGRAVWRLVTPLAVYLTPGRATPAPSNRMAIIPAGFMTDGASIPWWSRGVLDPWARLGRAAVLHDFLLVEGRLKKWEADLLFLAALRSTDVPALLATLLYFAARFRRRPRLSRPATPAVDNGATAPSPLAQQ